ncbi:Flp pilus assembly protein CpaB [Acidimicrobiia bacterium EGI L10123]|uniref:Flp pilus assembly protein CpaB n=1 Tax=Salinilacustrithrix flava TaxID=2957203 RepID=UPI003D7C2209|nr:Flp pilus assembly protein CpaB [Acidimicrobiia bacterium EGI L10123]
MKKKRASLIGAVLLVALGTFALVKYVSTAEDRALAGEELVDVLVLDASVPAGTAANELQQYLRVEAVPVKVQTGGALASLSEADGMVTAVDLVEGEQLTASRLVDATEFNALQARVGRGGGTVAVPEGLLEITIPLDPIRAVGGTVRPGDLVGLIASFDQFQSDGAVGPDGQPVAGENVSGFLLHKLLVTNVQGAPVPEAAAQGATTDNRAPTPVGQLYVTLALDAAAAERVVYASKNGDIWLAIEPADADESGTAVQTADRIFG